MQLKLHPSVLIEKLNTYGHVKVSNGESKFVVASRGLWLASLIIHSDINANIVKNAVAKVANFFAADNYGYADARMAA